MNTDSLSAPLPERGSPRDEWLDLDSRRADDLAELSARLAGRAPPTGRFARFWTLSTTGGRVLASRALGWLRTAFDAPEARERALAEQHWRAALACLGAMGYLRGAVQKCGQVLASYPDVLPREALELFERLHCEAPPMHFSLLRERVEREFDQPIDALFDEFERDAFAAASIGQVHRATLGGRPVAVKIQYPGIARAIQADLDNARWLLAPLRLGRNWDNLMAQLEETCRVLLAETDYLREALWTERARTALAELPDVAVPRVLASRSTARVLTTEFFEGLHLDDWLATRPGQAARDRAGAAIWASSLRLWASGRLLNTDPGRGNFLFLPDGRVALLDFGSVREFDAREWESMLLGVRAQREGGAAQRDCIRRTTLSPDLEEDSEGYRSVWRTCDWLWEPLRQAGTFDFGARDYIDRGMRLFGESVRAGHTRQDPVFLWCSRQFFGLRALLWSLGARIDAQAIAEAEYGRAGL